MNEIKQTKGTKTMTWLIIGSVILMFAIVGLSVLADGEKSDISTNPATVQQPMF